MEVYGGTLGGKNCASWHWLLKRPLHIASFSLWNEVGSTVSELHCSGFAQWSEA